MKVKLFSGSLYFVTFIDDPSKKLWVYTMKNKNDDFCIFKIFHLIVEREIRKLLKYLRSVNDEECCSNEFV